jgi:hypothetical protein
METRPVIGQRKIHPRGADEEVRRVLTRGAIGCTELEAERLPGDRYDAGSKSSAMR